MMDALKHIPRVRINFLPTPLVELKRLGAVLGGPKIFIKRDDLTGPGLGGNKTRKLEFLLGEALSRNCDVVITGGAMQSNHCRQTAAACAAAGLECHLALGGEAPAFAESNLLLDQLLGAHVHWCGAQTKGEQMPVIAEQLRARGRKPYIIPFGGSNATGALGLVAAMGELKMQLPALAPAAWHVITPSASGGTHAGMTVGMDVFGLDAQLMGIAIDLNAPGEPAYESELAHLANHVAEKIGYDKQYTTRDFHMRYDFFGGGYRVVGALEREAIQLVGRHEGILLDPVYSGRAMGGLIALIRNKEFLADDAVVFWHTGGTPAIFEFARELGATP